MGDHVGIPGVVLLLLSTKFQNNISSSYSVFLFYEHRTHKMKYTENFGYSVNDLFSIYIKINDFVGSSIITRKS